MQSPSFGASERFAVSPGDEANSILHAMLHQADDGLGLNMFDDSNIVVFCPIGDSATFTDPSYVLPGFYQLFAKWADQDNDRWQKITEQLEDFI